jgi:hypothetical protein
MGVAAATATAVAGPVVALAGYAALALAGAVAAAALGPFLLAVARAGPPGHGRARHTGALVTARPS